MWAAVSNSASLMTLLSWFGQTARCGWLTPKKKITLTTLKEFSPPQFYCFNCCTVEDKENTVCVCVSSFPYSFGNNASLSVFSPSLKVCDSVLLLNIVYSFLLASSSCQMPVFRCKLSSCKVTSCFTAVTELFCLWNFLHNHNACKNW